MPIISVFPSGSGGSSGGGLALSAATNIATLSASGKVYIKWTDPEDMVVAGSTLATWGGTLLVRKAGSAPVSRRDGTVVLDNKERNAYSAAYFCDTGLTDGVTYYYKLFPYTTGGAYTDDTADEFHTTPNPVTLGNVSNMSTAAGGNEKLAIQWTDPEATVVTDGVTLATWANTVVVVKEGSYAAGKDDGDAVFTQVVTTRNQYAASPLTATGLTNGATYYVSFFPVSTDGAVNTDSANRATGTANRITIASPPAQSGTLTYNGNAQNPTWDGYDAGKMTVSGETVGTDAGDYTAAFTLSDDYMWSDGSATAQSVTWTIGKAEGSITLSKTTVTLNTSTLSDTVTVTRLGDGTITAVSSNTDVATVTVSENGITITSVDETTGTATVTVSVGESKNYNAAADAVIAVTAQFIDPVLDNNSWEVISEISAKQTGSNYWGLGDCKSVTLSGTVGTLSVSGAYWVYIIGFDHNSGYEGTGIHFQGFKTAQTGGTDICLVDSGYGNTYSGSTKYFNMNHWGSSSSSPYNTNYGGWSACDLRYDILGSTDTKPSVYGSTKTTSAVGYDASTTCATSPVANTLMAALPSDLRSVMKPMTKYQDNKGNSSNTAANVTATVDYLPLLAEYEIFGARTYANTYEQNYQQQYAYYAAGNSKVKYRHSATASTANWWERSPSYTTASSFCFVYTDGSANNNHSRFSLGLSPAFKI